MSQAELNGVKILFYTDARHFGGHEVASLQALASMLRSGASIHAFFRNDNQVLRVRINALRENHHRLQLHPLAIPTLKYPALRSILYRSYLNQLRCLFRQVQADLVFVSQGNLLNSWAGAKVARDLGVPGLSYIPMAQPLRILLGAKGWLRELLSREVIQWPRLWLTCTEAQIHHLRAAGAKQPINILPNPIAIPNCRSREAAREANQIPVDALVIGMAGRLNNRQKGCDLFVEALLGSAPDSLIRRTWLLFIGEGEERPNIERKLSQAGWSGRMRFTGWTQEPWDHYAALDLLLMPSRFEGQPLAMQEALMCAVPVCGSRIDGLQDYLPDEWLCPANNTAALRQGVEQMLHNLDHCKIQLQALRERIKSDNSASAITNKIHAALKKILP